MLSQLISNSDVWRYVWYAVSIASI